MDIVFYLRKKSEAISGAKVATNETIPLPTWGSDINLWRKYVIGFLFFSLISLT